MSHTAEKPVLFVDVDGVISLFGFSLSDGVPGPIYWIDGVAHCISPAAGPALVQLAERFDLVWATGWEQKANEHLPAILRLPFGELPCLDFGGRAVWGSSHWKLEAITNHAGKRPVAWIDDNLGDDIGLWALERNAPTLLVQTRSPVGITEEHVSELLSWAGSLAPSSGNGRTQAA